MNTITLNGVSSNSITGLLIQELPPISKPLMRTEVETIDGRDGDIVTKLGYSAYDKTVLIGLRRNFDIDTVIEYFNSEGTVIFSNEPNKVYNYQILQQIDFERLLRFRTAEVVLHVQPFKFSATEGERSIPIISSPASITITNNGNIYSRPKMTVIGSGTVNVSLNGNQIFVIDMSNSSTIIIDGEAMEAYGYSNTVKVLKNRLVTGNYENFVLRKGENTLTFSGGAQRVAISKYSRWI